MGSLTPELWNLLDRMRSQGHFFDPLSILKEARAQGIPIGFDELRYLAIREGPDSGIFICPEFISAFIISYLSYLKTSFRKSEP